MRRGVAMKRVAVVGSGISGLAVAHALAAEAHVTLFEAGTYSDGHTHTADIRLDGIRHSKKTSVSDMSFSLQRSKQLASAERRSR